MRIVTEAEMQRQYTDTMGAAGCCEKCTTTSIRKGWRKRGLLNPQAPVARDMPEHSHNPSNLSRAGGLHEASRVSYHNPARIPERLINLPKNNSSDGVVSLLRLLVVRPLQWALLVGTSHLVTKKQ